MAATPRTTASRAAKTAGPGEITVPIMGELIPLPDRTDDYETFVRDLRGRPVPAWSATKVAGMVLASTPGLLSVEMWIAPGEGTPNVTLARFTRRRAGTIPTADTIGAVRRSGVQTHSPGMTFERRTGRRETDLPKGEPAE